MNWEPMTEDAVFLADEWLLIAKMSGYTYETVNHVSGRFYLSEFGTVDRTTITHFCRITNPNKPNNTTKEQTP